ncbi:wall-associated receptor kinase 2-like [Chenopodium quinoa]|uniref:Uncharacterized protein n=1 Tax=Chenopodium quinoa TaxID=63459 RepID=A0A803M5H7_CHEQI|nr:wall-associated receptor kinase 2-like [Chenopodium quinoa]
MLKADFGWRHHTLLTIFATIVLAILPLTNSQIALPGCPEKCGNVTIPYPFGIGDKCHYDHPEDGFYYDITCNTSNIPVVPTYGSIEIEKISLNGEFRVRNYISYSCYDKNGIETRNFTSWISITRFSLSTTRNIAGAIGCDTLTLFSGTRMESTNLFQTGCVTGCTNQTDVSNECSGIGCCLASIPNGITNITLGVGSLYNHKDVQDFNPCSIAFVVAKDYVEEKGTPFSFDSILIQDAAYLDTLSTPMVYNWSIGTEDCKTALAAKNCLCKGNSTCFDATSGQWGYHCKCNLGFEGNPYLHDCQDIDECANNSLNSCEKQEYCVNVPGNYTCTCPKGYYGKGTKENPCTLIDTDSASRKKLLLAIRIIIGIAGGIIVSLLVIFWFHWQHGNKKIQKLREKCFHQNGGHILQQKLSGRDVSIGNTVKMFTDEELKKATDNYSENSIIGRGGFGMVFKGILPNNQVVAIKRSIKVDSTQVEQFINEVVALSQINNKNVVKLLGCCLETEVPLLVYEFISNGTLHDHLHDEGKMYSFTWDVRLRIAAEVAEVLAYLHTTISIPIIHRDIKSANILLDDKCVAKVADFGASKLAPVDQEQLGTMVQGTCGYLDPEYMQTGELTDKSDVYSFGVVLVELLTREKAISYAKPENERSLAVCFLRKIKEDRLFEIFDEQIVSDSAMEQLKEVANLARRCLKLKGEDRPTMKEVARELERIRCMTNHPWLSNNSVLLQEESEYLLGEAHDFNNGYGNDGMNYSSSSQSRVVQLVPLDDGR